MLPENFRIYYMKFGSLVVTSEHAADVMQESKLVHDLTSDIVGQTIHVQEGAWQFSAQTSLQQGYAIVLCTSSRVFYHCVAHER